MPGMRSIKLFHPGVFTFLILVLLGSEVDAKHIRSPEVHDDRCVTLRLKSERANEVVVKISGQTYPLVKGDEHIWSVTTEPLVPGIHDYSFEVDGTRVIDPSNRHVKKWFSLASMVEIPGDPPLLTEFTDVPHGVVQRVIYPSKSVGKQRPVMVYTPAGYATSPVRYPVVVLLHGFGDDETAWTEVGRAHLIADNLIAAGKIRPCVIAMPFGHPMPAPFGDRPTDYFTDNADLYEKDITSDLLPFLHQRFLVLPDRDNTVIAGLSMGGGQAIDTGLGHIDKFSSIGAFSAATPQLDDDNLLRTYPALAGSEPAANGLHHFWIPIGTSDFLLKRNDKFVAQLKEAGILHSYRKTDGGHEWKLWREYFAEYLQMTLPIPEGDQSDDTQK